MTTPVDEPPAAPIGPGPAPTPTVDPATDRLPRTAAGTNAGAFAPTDWGLLAACTLIWGSSFYFMAIGLRALEPGVITFLRVMFGALALGALPASRTRVRREDWPRLVVLGATWMAIPFTMFPLAQQWIDSSLTGMLNAAMPVLTAIVALLIARQLPGPAQAVGLAVGLAGTIAIGWDGLGDGGSTALGVVLVFVAVSSYAVSVNIAVPLQHRYGSLPILVRIQLVAMVLTAPFAAAGLPDSRFELRPVLAIVVLGVFGTGLAFAVMGTLMGRVGATRASVTTYLMPIVSIALGAALLDEAVHPAAVVGTVLVLVGAWLVSRAERAAT
ncbi:DMT family transporter [Actinomarinicola tropica]|uniref:EamA family transporter n=1 Tax=Actinomarinicola tropica TaxID=2789776 RepID=A0A5Q2RUE4_9ACTN|nr:DMT family transporter [Actinomarinicola tropica]QGG96835.1 EamA family transporter [Actinomarinicola tropica]